MIRLLFLPALTLVLGLALGDGPGISFSGPASYPGHLAGALTGGFGEQTCRSCHFDFERNPGGGTLSVDGIAQKLTAGQTLSIVITLEREALGAAGFQLSARYADGRQAGSFEIGGNARLMFSRAVPDSLQYVQHTREGSQPSEAGRQQWRVAWRAPDAPCGAVVFHIAANAANGDRSEFGDFIYEQEIKAGFP